MAGRAMPTSEAIKLRAKDGKDIDMLSGLLQDATVLIGDMAHDPDHRQFLMVAARFVPGPDGDRRLLTGVNFDGVETVSRKGFSPADRDEVLNLLAIRAEATSIELVFSGEATIRLECPEIKVYAADLGEGWPTSFSPSHDA